LIPVDLGLLIAPDLAEASFQRFNLLRLTKVMDVVRMGALAFLSLTGLEEARNLPHDIFPETQSMSSHR
jgi:hypothetical protein